MTPETHEIEIERYWKDKGIGKVVSRLHEMAYIAPETLTEDEIAEFRALDAQYEAYKAYAGIPPQFVFPSVQTMRAALDERER